MFRSPFRLLAGVVLVGLIGATMVAPAGAAGRTQAQQGVTDNEITIVSLVSDLDGLRSRGFPLGAKLTTGNLVKRWQGYADAFCKAAAEDGIKGVKVSGNTCTINGRKVTVKPAVWDPIDATTFDKACIQATQDNKPLVVVQGNGYRQSSIGCITVDNKTPMFFGESVYAALNKASGNRLLTLGVEAEPNAKATVALIKKTDLIPGTAKICILGGNEPGLKAAADALDKELKAAKYTVSQRVDVNTLSADPTVQNRESGAAVATFKSAGCDTVFVVIPFTASAGYYQEAQRSNAGFKTLIFDAATSLCTQFGASRTPAEVAGAPCVTTWDTRAVPAKNAIKADNAFEKQCRTDFDAFMGGKSLPGVPAGDVTAGGVTYSEDFAPNECTIMSLLIPAIAKAGKKVTWDKVYDQVIASGKGPAAYMSNGEGQFTKGKQYYATQIHVQTLNTANANTAKDANGLFNGNPAPVNAWVPQLIDGQEWFPVNVR
ncbi:MAG: hypothetical protein ACKOVH_06485 [Actinomycetota bacterium]